MAIISILFGSSSAGPDRAAEPEYFRDLNLDQIVQAVIRGNDGPEAPFRTLSRDVRLVEFRQQIFRDLERPAVLAAAERFTASMAWMRRRLKALDRLGHPPQAHRWFLEIVLDHAAAVTSLAEGLDVTSPGLQAFRDGLLDHVGAASFVELREQARRLLDRLGEVRYDLLLREDKITVSGHDPSGHFDYAERVLATFARFRPDEPLTERRTPVAEPGLDRVESGVLDLVVQVHPEVFGELAEFCARHRDFISGEIVRADLELNPDAIPGTRDLHAPVAYVQTPVTATPKSLCEAILNFYGEPFKGMTLPQLGRAVRASLRDHGTKVLILDDITRLKMHREADQDVLDQIRSLMSMSVTLILIGVGIPRSGLLRNAALDPGTGQWVFPPRGDDAETQTERRFDLVSLDPFRYDTAEDIEAWIAHLAGIEHQLRLMRAEPGMLTSGTMSEYLFQRTNGIVGFLERLIEDGCTEAIDSGEEQLTSSLLDGINISLNPLPSRDPAAGEIPDIPPKPARTGKRRSRNTVFDDPAGRPRPATPGTG